MKLPHSYVLGALGAIVLASTAAAQSSTPVIGYYKQSLTSGLSTLTAGFVTKTDFQGLATSTGASSITRTGAAWSAGAFDASATQRYYVEVLDGPWAGQIIDISTNTADTLNLVSNISGLSLSSTVKFAVRKHATISTLFPGGGGFQDGDNVTIFNSGVPTVLAWDPSASVWYNAVTNLDALHEVIEPGQGVLVNCGGARTITVGGNEVSYVKTTPTRIGLEQGKFSLVGVLNPLVPDNILISAIGLENAAPASSMTLTDSDVFSVYTPGVTGIKASYAFDGTSAYNVVTNADLSAADTMGAGSAIGIIPSADRSFKQNVTHPIN